jgi:hypothetical protein
VTAHTSPTAEASYGSRELATRFVREDLAGLLVAYNFLEAEVLAPLPPEQIVYLAPQQPEDDASHHSTLGGKDYVIPEVSPIAAGRSNQSPDATGAVLLRVRTSESAMPSTGQSSRAERPLVRATKST